MRPEDLVFWLDVLRDSREPGTGVLCQRHGDSMVVPRGWTLDDLRDPDLHLFRPPPRPDGPARRQSRHRRRAQIEDGVGQLALGGLGEPMQRVDDEQVVQEQAVQEQAVDTPVATPDAEVGGDEPGESDDDAVRSEPRAVVPDDEAATALAWKPAFDDGDDLDGLLAARSPLLSRAFRGADRDE